MLKAYDIAAGWPKAVDPGGPGIQPVVSSILPETGAPPALIPAMSGFPLAVARQFPGGHPLGGRPQGPESGPVRPGQTFEIFKIACHNSDHSGAVFSFSLFHLNRWPSARTGKKRAKSARGFTVKFGSINRPSGPVRLSQTFQIFKIACHGSDHSGAVFSFFIFHFPFNAVAIRKDQSQAQSDPVRPLKFLKSSATAATAPVRFLHFSFFIFHLTRWPSARAGVRPSQTRSDLSNFLKITRRGKMVRLPKPLRRMHTNSQKCGDHCFYILHFPFFLLKIGGFKVIQGYSRWNFFSRVPAKADAALSVKNLAQVPMHARTSQIVADTNPCSRITPKIL